MFKAELEVTGRAIGKAKESGVRVIAGSETGFAITPIGEWHARELEMLVEYAGFTPMEAIKAATSEAAWVMKMDGRLGAVAPGCAADVIVVDGDPLRDIKVLAREGAITEVIKAGRRIDITTPIPDRGPRPGEKVAFLATCPLTRSFALEDTNLAPKDVLTDQELSDLAKA